jgi:hypothetical protein
VDKIEVDVGEIEWDDMEWIDLAHYKDQHFILLIRKSIYEL